MAKSKRKFMDAEEQWKSVIRLPEPEYSKRIRTGLHRDSPVRILPHLNTGQETMQRLLIALRERLEKELPPSTRRDAGFASPGVPGDWSGLMTLSGVHSNPSGTPPPSGLGIRERVLQRKLERLATKARDGNQAAAAAHRGVSAYLSSGKITPGHRALLKLVTKILINDGGPANIPVNALSTMGMPHGTRDLFEKRKAASQWLKQGAIWMRAAKQGQLRQLAEQSVMFVYVNSWRTQTDGAHFDGDTAVPNKVRDALTIDGEWVESSKTDFRERKVGRDSPISNMFVANRNRAFGALSFMAAFPAREVARSIEEQMFHLFPFMLLHRGSDDIESKLTGVIFIWIIDFPNHDQIMPTDGRDELIDRIATEFSELAAHWMMLCFRAPNLARMDYVGEAGATFRSNFLDPAAFTADYVNPSGIPITSVLAKLMGIFYAVVALVDAGLVEPTEEDLRSLFTGGHRELVLLNIGDNLIFGAKTPRAAGIIPTLDLYLHYTSIDEAATFAGFVPVETGGGAVSFIPNILSYVVKWFCHDRDLASQYREFWAHGWQRRKEEYKRAPTFAIANTVVQEECLRIVGSTMDDIAERNYRDPGQLLKAQSVTDTMFVEEPERIHYRFRPSDVSPDLLQRYYLIIEGHEAESIYRIVKGESK